MIQVQNVSLAYGDRVLFKEVNFQLLKGNRYGLVGANGTGKTTFCKILSGGSAPSSGKVQIPNHCKIGVLLQNQYAFEEERIIDVVIQGKEKLWEAIKQKNEILNKESEITVEEGLQLAEIEGILADHHAYQAEADAAIILEGLKIPTEKHEHPMSTLSGGYKIRVLLARMLFSDPDVIFLDEPNNHLDLESIRWLEKYLTNFDGLVLLISHDHHLINRVSTHILDIDYQEIRIYKGNYDEFVEQKQNDEILKQKSISVQERKRDELQKFVDKFSAKATKARQANSKKKMIEKIELEEIVRSSRRSPKFRFEQSRPSGREVLNVQGISKQFEEKKILDNVNFQITRGKKLAVLGYNGAGKSTLLKILVDQLKADQGNIHWGYETKVGYFAQNQRDLITDKDTPYDWLYQFGPAETISTIRGILGLMLFNRDEVMKTAASLSGGELSRLIFAKLIYQKNNVLILDEPTNHLDLDSIEALIQALKNYEGTLIFVSHDEYFVSNLADSFLYFNEEGIHQIDTDYETFEKNWLSDQPAEKKANPKNKTKDSKPKNKKKNQKLERKIEKLEERITQLEKRNEELSHLLNDPELYQEEKKVVLEPLLQEQKRNQTETEQLMEEWETTHQQLEHSNSSQI